MLTAQSESNIEEETKGGEAVAIPDPASKSKIDEAYEQRV
jgi:hypothetical protein